MGKTRKTFGWRSKIQDYSLTLGAAIHMIDLVCWLIDSRPIEVKALGNDKLTKNTRFKKKSLVVMFFKFPRDIIVKISANGVAIHNHFHELKIFSKKKTLINSNHGSFIYDKRKKLRINKQYPDKKIEKKLIQNFIDSILDKKVRPIISLKEQFDLMSICFAVDKSIKLNKTVKIKYL